MFQPGIVATTSSRLSRQPITKSLIGTSSSDQGEEAIINITNGLIIVKEDTNCISVIYCPPFLKSKGNSQQLAPQKWQNISYIYLYN